MIESLHVHLSEKAELLQALKLYCDRYYGFKIFKKGYTMNHMLKKVSPCDILVFYNYHSYDDKEYHPFPVALDADLVTEIAYNWYDKLDMKSLPDDIYESYDDDIDCHRSIEVISSGCGYGNDKYDGDFLLTGECIAIKPSYYTTGK